VLELLSFAATVASLILSIGAIWLSIVFYRLSNEASKTTTEASKGIGASVERLEKLFDKLYSDTFSMMRDTVTDMRKHMWPEEETAEQEKTLEEVENKADEKVSELKVAMEAQIKTIVDEQRMAHEENQALKEKMLEVVDRAILSSRKVEVEATEETLRAHLIREIHRRARPHRSTRLGEIVARLNETFPLTRVLDEIARLKSEHVIELDPDAMSSDSIVRLTKGVEAERFHKVTEPASRLFRSQERGSSIDTGDSSSAG
jgi:hypothetical protein